MEATVTSLSHVDLVLDKIKIRSTYIVHSLMQLDKLYPAYILSRFPTISHKKKAVQK
jgi:hypothetical protein